jgi:hypothetical protein
MKKLLLFLILIVALFSGYSMRKIDNLGVIDLLSQPSDKLTKLSEIASDVEYIPLQTSENSLISYIHDLKTDSTRFYIYILTKILCFDKKGKFLYELDNTGRGPEEYIYINDWDISPENNLLLIYANRKILLYNNTGNSFVFIKSLNFNEILSKADFIPGQNAILLSFFSPSGDEPLRNVVINFFGDTLKVRQNCYKYILSKNMGFGMTWDNLIYNYNDAIHFKEMLSDTVFTIDQNKKVKPYFIFNSHGKHLTPQALANFSFVHLFDYIQIVNVMEVPRYILYNYGYTTTMYFEIYDKVLNKIFGIDTKAFLIDDITGGVNFEPKFCSGDKLYSWVDALILKKYVSSETFVKSFVKNPQKKKVLKELADSLKETDNPILIVVTPKE